MALQDQKAEEPGSEQPKEEVVKISSKDLSELMSRLKKLEEDKSAGISKLPSSNLDTADLIAKIVAEVRKADRSGPVNPYVNVDPSIIDKDDILETPVVFYAHKCGYVITSDMKQGRSIGTPYGTPIIFTFHGSKKMSGSGKEQDIVNLSTYVCKSKAELEFLKNFTYFGSLIFEDAQSASGIDARKATKMAKFIKSTENLDAYRLQAIAKERGLPMMKDIQQMRLIVATSFAEDELRKEDKELEIRVTNSVKEARFLQPGS